LGRTVQIQAGGHVIAAAADCRRIAV